MSSNFDTKQFFPFAVARSDQQKAIDFALDAYINKGKKFVILELGTGVGKSATGLTIAKYLNAHRNTAMEEGFKSYFNPGAYFLTTQKILQEQYVKDFGAPKGAMCSIKSSENYDCTFMKGNTCGESQRAVQFQKGTPFWNACAFKCHYKEEKKRFIDSAESITNFSYFLAESKYAGKITPRDLLVIDECHNIEGELSKFIEITFSETFSTKVLKLEFPDVRTPKQAMAWIKDVYKPKLQKHIEHIGSMLAKYGALKTKLQELSDFSRQHSMLDKHICKVNRFLEIYEEDNWVMNQVAADGRSLRKIEFKPVDVSKYSEDTLFKYGHRVLLMSATILDKDIYCESLGIDPSRAEFLSIESPFPDANRPVFYMPVGKMGKDDIDKTLPTMAKYVKEILKQHKDDKGIIHCHTFKIANYLKQNVKDSRILIHDSVNKEEVLKEHMTSKKPTVLLSPSSTEGLDLKGDMSRFQVMCKLPFPFLGDKLTKKRMAKHKWWYGYQTAKVVIQAFGRSIRDEKDYAVSYILDGNWEHFYRTNSHLFPQYFKRTLQ